MDLNVMHENANIKSNISVLYQQYIYSGRILRMTVCRNDIYMDLRKRIGNLDYQPGDILSEKELIEQYCTSRTPVREALLRLAQDRLVSIIPRVGTYVSHIDIRSVKYAYEVKKNLEGLAAELAARRASQQQVEDLLSMAERFGTYDNVKDYGRCIDDDRTFHALTREASGNPMLIAALDELSLKTVRFLKYIQYVEDDYDWYKGSMKAIAAAIAERDPGRAKAEAESHTEAFLSKLASYFFSC